MPQEVRSSRYCSQPDMGFEMPHLKEAKDTVSWAAPASVQPVHALDAGLLAVRLAAVENPVPILLAVVIAAVAASAGDERLDLDDRREALGVCEGGSRHVRCFCKSERMKEKQGRCGG